MDDYNLLKSILEHTGSTHDPFVVNRHLDTLREAGLLGGANPRHITLGDYAREYAKRRDAGQSEIEARLWAVIKTQRNQLEALK